jgi:hypothetical protein
MAAELSPKTIVNYSQVVKMVIASAVNADGEAQSYTDKCRNQATSRFD